MNNRKEIEIEKEELAEAITHYVAGKSGVMEEVEPEEAGRRGAFIKDIADTIEKHAKEEITTEELEKEIVEKTTCYAVSGVAEKIVSKAIDISAEVIKKIVKKILPAAEKLIDTVKEPLKRFVVEKITRKVAKVAYKGWVKIKTFVKKILS